MSQLRHKHIEQLAILTDVDMTLVPSMSTVLHHKRKSLTLDLHEALKGAFAVVTGRPGHSVDRTFRGQLPASVEHHSAWRPRQGDGFIALSPRLNAEELGAFVRSGINGDMELFREQKQVLGDRPGVFIELKKHSLALVFSAAATPDDQRQLLVSVAERARDEFGLKDSHRIARSSDAVEIVPIGHDKGDAVRHFMDTANFKGKIPVFIGDSSSDAKGMKVCAEEYGGFGIAVAHGIPDAPYVEHRVDTVEDVWKWLRSTNRAVQKKLG